MGDRGQRKDQTITHDVDHPYSVQGEGGRERGKEYGSNKSIIVPLYSQVLLLLILLLKLVL